MNTAETLVIELRGARVAAMRDPSRVVLEDVNWPVRSGEFWVVAGPPHSGKSDLLLHAAGLMSPLQGTCRVLGCEAAELDETHLDVRRRVGFVFADGRLFHQFTIFENVALPLRYHQNLPPAEAAQTVARLLELLELTPYASQRPGQVPAAWRQRAALARALVLKPELLVLDNPSGSLMARHRFWLVDFLDQLGRGHAFLDGRPLTLVVSTDDPRLWQHPRRQFAAIHEGTFTALGTWNSPEFDRHPAMRELLAAPPETKRADAKTETPNE
jgi:ABC-type transporter Mla maintaining outer membrane lipid asymmetry ATPase subunit MlaF